MTDGIGPALCGRLMAGWPEDLSQTRAETTCGKCLEAYARLEAYRRRQAASDARVDGQED